MSGTSFVQCHAYACPCYKRVQYWSYRFHILYMYMYDYKELT